jgi:nitroreductase
VPGFGDNAAFSQTRSPGDTMIDKQDILDAYNFRHACKEFDPERKIARADFDFILETGRLSPSSFGFEPWKFVVLQDMAMRERLLPVTWGARKSLPTASHYVAILVHKGGMRPDAEHIGHIMRDIQQLPAERIAMKLAMYRKFQEHDFALRDDRALLDWAGKQAYIALGNMMTAAAMIGIDTCPIEGFVQADAEAVLADAGILDRSQWSLAVMVAFGYRIKPQPAKTRQALADIVSWVE